MDEAILILFEQLSILGRSGSVVDDHNPSSPRKERSIYVRPTSILTLTFEATLN